MSFYHEKHYSSAAAAKAALNADTNLPENVRNVAVTGVLEVAKEHPKAHAIKVKLQGHGHSSVTASVEPVYVADAPEAPETQENAQA